MPPNAEVNDLAEYTFIGKLPKPLRYLLFIPASIAGSLLATLIFNIINSSAVLIGSHISIIDAGIRILSDSITGMAFVYIAAYVVPKFQLQVAYIFLILGAVGTSIIWAVLLAGGTFHATHNAAYYTSAYVLAIVGALVGFSTVYDQKKEKLSIPFIIVGVALLVGSITWFSTKTFSSNQTAFSVTNVAPYVSTADGFQINFPIKPQVKPGSQTSSNGTVTWNSYESFNTGGTKQYTVGVYNYPLSYGDFSQLSQQDQISSLDTAVNNGAKSASSSESVLDITPLTFKSLQAVEAHLSIAGKYSEKLDGYEIDFEKGQTEYSIFAAGVNQSDFNQFANSFKLL